MERQTTVKKKRWNKEFAKLVQVPVVCASHAIPPLYKVNALPLQPKIWLLFTEADFQNELHIQNPKNTYFY